MTDGQTDNVVSTLGILVVMARYTERSIHLDIHFCCIPRQGRISDDPESAETVDYEAFVEKKEEEEKKNFFLVFLGFFGVGCLGIML